MQKFVQVIETSLEKPKDPHVLLVEDSLIALRMIEFITAEVGLSFTSVMDGEQAIEAYETLTFDMIITDIGLPGISGYELTQYIRNAEKQKQLRRIPIVGITAHTREETECKALQSGMDWVLSKPITAKLLRELVVQFIS